MTFNLHENIISVQCPPAVVATAINMFHRQRENAIFVQYFGMHALLWARIVYHYRITHACRFTINTDFSSQTGYVCALRPRQFSIVLLMRIGFVYFYFCSTSMRLSSVFRVIASKYLLSWCLKGHLYFFVWMIYIPLCCTQQLPRKFVTFQLELKCPTVWRANIIPNNLYDVFFVKKKNTHFKK